MHLVADIDVNELVVLAAALKAGIAVGRTRVRRSDGVVTVVVELTEDEARRFIEVLREAGYALEHVALLG